MKTNLPVRYQPPPRRLRKAGRLPGPPVRSQVLVRHEPRLLAALWSVDGGGRNLLVSGLAGAMAGVTLGLALAAVLGLSLFILGTREPASKTPVRSRPRLAVLPSPPPTLPASSPAVLPAHPFFSIEVIERDLDFAGLGESTPGAIETSQLSPEPAPTAIPFLAWPAPGPISQGFGCSSYYTGLAGPGCPVEAPWFHDGLDIAAPAGTPVLAGLAGTILFAGPDGTGPLCQDGYRGYGLVVVIDNGQGWQALLAHLDRVEVTAGQLVTPATIIGRAGETGCTSGPHLHFGLRYQGDLVDPRPALEEGRHKQ